MKKWLVLGIVVVSFICGNYCYAADASLGMTANSAYVWRGITFNDGFVLQPSLDVTKGGFGVNVWGNMDIDDYDDTLDNGQFSEIDLTLSYGFTLDMVEMSVGYIEYLFPNAEDTPAGREVFLTCGISPLKGLSLGAALYYEIDEIEDLYAALSGSYGLSLADNLGIELGVSIGYIGKDYSVGGEAGLNDITTYLSATYTVMENLDVTAAVYYVDTLDEDVLPEPDTNTFGGLTVSYAF